MRIWDDEKSVYQPLTEKIWFRMPHLGHVNAAPAVTYGRRRTDTMPRPRRLSLQRLFRRRPTVVPAHPSVARSSVDSAVGGHRVATTRRAVMQLTHAEQPDYSGVAGRSLRSPG